MGWRKNIRKVKHELWERGPCVTELTNNLGTTLKSRKRATALGGLRAPGSA